MNYWDVLKQADAALADGRFREAESLHDAAAAAREASPRRRFVSETLPDGARRLWLAVQRRPAPAEPAAGRWERALAAFAGRFERHAAERVDQALRLAELRPEDDADTNQPALEAALYLTTRSRLHPADPGRGARLLRAAFRTAAASGRPFAADLVQRDLPLGAADRLWLVRQGEAILAPLTGAPGEERATWTRALLGLLDPEVFAGDEAAEEERRWLAARLADGHLEDPEAVLDHLRSYLALLRRPRERADRIRLRTVQILANIDRPRLAVPRYDEALTLMGQEEPEPGGEAAVQMQEVAAVIGARRPAETPTRAWVSAARDAGGRCHFVFWWDAAPTDTATWAEGEDPAPLRAFLAAAAGRLFWSGEGPPAELAAAVPESAAGRAVAPLVEALLEPWIPAGGLQPGDAERFGLARTGPWRENWHPRRGHPLLAPPGTDGRLGREQAALEPALRAGLLWLACRHRLDTADPALRAGLGELGRRGDTLATFLHDAAVLGSATRSALDASFTPWTLPVLWARPDPLAGPGAGDPPGDGAVRRDLAGNDVAVVTTGRPARALAAWDDGSRRWRVVLDHGRRLDELRAIAAGAYGPVTVVPQGGHVHDLAAALRRLEELAASERTGVDALLAVFHWVRLVETHNGDLLDFRRLRPRPAGVHALGDLYAESVADLPAVAPRAAEDPAQRGWGAQYCQRVRRSGLVVGTVHEVTVPRSLLDDLWGVFDGSEASWVFLDAAAVHWTLVATAPDGAVSLHAHLASRGRRHLSVVTAGAVLAADLETVLAEILAPYGRPYHVGLGDSDPPRLRLVGPGPVPGARLLAMESWTAPLGWLAAAGGPTLGVLEPADDLAGAFWREAAAGRFGDVDWTLTAPVPVPHRGLGTGAVTRLAVPLLRSLGRLDGATTAVASRPPVDRWREADARRADAIAQQRRLAALEINALLAAGYDSVEILDGRWWRRLAPPGTAPAAAAEAAGAAAADVLDLGGGVAAREDLRRAVAAWLADRSGPEPPPFVDAGEVAGPTAGRVTLHRSLDDAPWRRRAADLLRKWEAGGPLRRLVVLADEPPAGAAWLAATLGGVGRSVPVAGTGPDGADRLSLPTAAPLVWLRPADLVRLPREELATLQPGAVVVAGVVDWLPTARGFRDDTARALAWLAACAPAAVDLIAGPLGPAWEEFLARALGQDEGSLRPAPVPGGWGEVRRGEDLRGRWQCVHCGQESEPRAAAVCRHCGAALAWADPGPGARPVDPGAALQRLLLRRRDLGRDRPLAVYSDVLAGTDPARSGIETATVSRGPDGERIWRLADGRVWSCHPLAGAGVASPAVDVMIAAAPAEPARLRPLAPAPGAGTASLVFDPATLDPRAGAPTRVAGLQRLVRLLRDRQAPVAGDDDGTAPAGFGADAVVPVVRLARLAGLPEADAREAIHVLVWAARATGDLPQAAAAAATAAPWLWVRHPYAGLEYVLRGLREMLPGALATALDAAVPGTAAEILAVCARRDDDEARDRAGQLDTLLCLNTPRESATTGARLRYWPVAGAWFDGRRWAGWTGDREAAVADLETALDSFAGWVREVMAAAIPARDGLVVRSDPVAPQSWPARWLVWGAELGLWQVAGPPGPEFVGRADLERLRESAALSPGSAALQLVRALCTERDRWHEALAITAPDQCIGWPVERPADAPPGGGGPLGLLRRREARDPLEVAEHAVRDLATSPEPGFLALAGPGGAGRHAALVDGLLAAADAERAPDVVTIWCPDTATAARVATLALRRRRGWPLDVRVAGPAAGGDELLAPAERRVTVLAEAQRFGRDLRYQLQDSGRNGRLVLTLDGGETGEAWEDLFLAAPRQDTVRELDEQRAQCRRLWDETAALRGDPDPGKARRRERGTVTSRCAGNLDECVSAVLAEFGTAPPRGGLDLTAPLAEDAAYLGRALAAQGWTAADRTEVEALLLPGARELTALLVDLARLAARRSAAASAPGGESEPVLTRLLPPLLGAAHRRWLLQMASAIPADVAAAWTLLARSPWGRLTCGRLAARERAAALVARHGTATPAEFAALPEVQGWGQHLAATCGFADLAPDRPVVRLADAGVPTGTPAAAGVWVCFGSEPAPVHARVLGRITDHALILYQEHSPLPSEAEEPAG